MDVFADPFSLWELVGGLFGGDDELNRHKRRKGLGER
jgi:hypothetical protein